jgi:hypothetical protein
VNATPMRRADCRCSVRTSTAHFTYAP